MRIAIASSLLVLAACGGTQKPADAPAPEPAAAEPAGSASADMPASPDSTSQAKPAASKPVAKAAPSSSSSESSEPPAAAPHPVPAVTGSIDGKSFEPKLARVNSAMQKDGRILVSLVEHGDCTTGSTPGDGVLTMLVPWHAGDKAALAALKRTTSRGAGEIGFARVGAGNKKAVSNAFKPSGTVTIVSAPMAANTLGKMKIDLQSGDYMLAGDLDIQMCVAPK